MLRILLGDLLVGHLERAGHGRTVFRFDAGYLALPERPVLGQWFEERLEPSLEYTERGSRLPSFFQNYLPEEHSALRALLARRTGVKAHHELPLLAALGADLPGAIVAEAVGRISIGAGAHTDSLLPAAPHSEDPPLRFSLAGMQLKFSVAQSQSRFTLTATGEGGHWIAKLPDRSLPGLPTNEFSTLSWAKEVGIQLPEFKLVDVADIDGLPADMQLNEQQALMIRRFDRGEGGKRIHQEDFAQVLDVRPGKKREGSGYTALAKVVFKACGEDDYHELVRRLVFMVLSGNANAHLKNWSLFYPDGRKPRLSPAYDLVCTLAYGNQLDQNMGMALLGQKDFDRITRAHFERMAEKIGASPEGTGKLVTETAERARDAWKRINSGLPITPRARVVLENHLDFIQI